MALSPASLVALHARASLRSAQCPASALRTEHGTAHCGSVNVEQRHVVVHYSC
jgi:hypothetical protein